MSLIYTKTRSKKKKQNTRKRQEDKKRWEETCRRMGVDPKKKSRQKFTPLREDANLRILEFHSKRLNSSIPSAPSAPVNTAGRRVVYEGEMAKREEAAQKEIERKKKRVAVPYNKGGYQYIDGYDPKDLGKKT